MKIQHVVVSMDPVQGGPPAVAGRLAAAQAAAGHDVGIVSHASPGREAQIEKSLAGIPQVKRVQLHTVPAGLKLGALVSAETTHQLGKLLTGVDIIHIHSVWEPLVWKASTLARAMGTPYVITTHGVLDPWCLQQKWLKKKIALLVAYRAMLNGAACLHLLNRDEADLIKPLGLAAPARVIPNGVFLDEIDPRPAPGSFHAKHPELKGDPFILFLSRLHFKKGLDFLADAFATLVKSNPQLRLVIAGPNDGAKADFQQRIASAGLTDRVHLVGSLYGADKFAAMVDARCFCLPSRQEGFSMAITEAMACGCPVVISRECHFPEVAEAGAGLVVSLDAGSVAAGLRAVLGDETRRIQMGQSGRKLVQSQFTWPRIAEQTIDMYQSALSARKKGA